VSSASGSAGKTTVLLFFTIFSLPLRFSMPFATPPKNGNK